MRLFGPPKSTQAILITYTMKSKVKLLSLFFLVSLLAVQAPPMESVFVKSKIKSLIVKRTFNYFDVFTVNMKANHKCTDDSVPNWCSSLGAYYGSYLSNHSSCSCICQIKRPYTFLPSIQKCATADEVTTFGVKGCPDYFNQQNLLAFPDYTVDLNGTATTFNKQFTLVKSNNCNLSGDYYVYDYTGFRSRWQTTKNDGFFKLNMATDKKSFQIEWLKDTNGILSGRIIRLNVTCSAVSQGQTVSSFTRCILLKAKGSVTYSAPPVWSTTNTGHTSSSVTKSSSSSLSQTSSVSLPPSTTDRSSSSPSSPSSFPRQPPSSSSILSPSPSLVLTSSTGTLGVPQSDLSFLPLTQSQTARLPAINTGQIRATTSAVIVPIEPAETTTTMSSSSAADGGPGKRGTQTGGNDNGVLIGAAVGGAVVLGILVIIFIVFWKRRKACESSEKQTKPVKNPLYGSSENAIQLEAPKESKSMPSIAQNNQPTYQSLVDDNGPSNGAAIYSSADDEYDNCNVYQSLDKQIPGTPVYGRLNKGSPEPAHTTGLPKQKPKAKTSVAGIPTSEANDVTGLPKPKPATTGQGTTPEPLYNVHKVTENPTYEQALAFDTPYAALIHRPGMQRESVHEPGGKTCKNPLYESISQSDNQHAAC